jgi:hypothetical protein
MSLPDEPAPLSPWPFLIADAIALGTAFYLGSQAHAPYSAAIVISIGALVAAGAVCSVLPFIINHARNQDLLLAERQREIAALAQTVGSCAEQLSIAAGSLHGIADAAAKSVKQAEQLPAKLQEKIHEFKEQLHEVSSTENEALSQEVNALRSSETERIESVVTTVRKLSGEFARLEAASRKHVTDLSDALERFSKSAQQSASEATAAIAASRTDSEKSLADAQAAAVRAIEDAVRRALSGFEARLAQLAAVPNAKDEPRAGGVIPALPPADAAPAEPKAARKKTEARRADSRTEEFDLGFDLPDLGASSEFSQPDPESNSAPAVSHDGLTRLLVTAYIGIGNKLFIRGEGPGLSWDQGVPLQFVSIGKWRWETADADSPVRIKLYKNDEQECAALGEVTVECGHQREVTATF